MVARVVDELPESRIGRHIAGQLIRSGTSSAPNYDEACDAESRRDFVHKLGIATKEMRETCGWLRFVIELELVPGGQMKQALDEATQLQRMLASSVLTVRKSERDDVLPEEDAKLQIED